MVTFKEVLEHLGLRCEEFLSLSAEKQEKLRDLARSEILRARKASRNKSS